MTDSKAIPSSVAVVVQPRARQRREEPPRMEAVDTIPVARASNVMGRRLDLIQTSSPLPPVLAVVTAMVMVAVVEARSE